MTALSLTFVGEYKRVFEFCTVVSASLTLVRLFGSAVQALLYKAEGQLQCLDYVRLWLTTAINLLFALSFWSLLTTLFLQVRRHRS